MAPFVFGRTANRMALLLVAALSTLAVPGRAGVWWNERGAAGMMTAQAIVAEWKIVDGNNQSAVPIIAQVDEQQVLVSGEAGLKITGQDYGPDTEITVRFGMDPPAGSTARLTASLLGDAGEGLSISVNGSGGSDMLEFNAAGATGGHRLCGVYQRSLHYPEQLRKLLDYEMTTHPQLAERWLTVLFVLRRQASELYVNDILVKTVEQPAGGTLQMVLTPHVQIVSVTSRPLPPDTLFEPVRIDSRLNAAKIDAGAVHRETLPASGATAIVQSVPFVFPKPDRQGNDHIALRPSRLQNGFLEGDFEPQAGLFGGRWAGALVENPTRIQFRIPKGRYSALHLICAADNDPESVPVVTAQIFKTSLGRPESFSARVPLLTAKSAAANALPIKLTSGEPANLYLVTIPIDLGSLAVFDDLESYNLELTKEVQYYRCYPDPTQFSVHPAGLPSSVHVYAATLERPAVSVDLQPDSVGNLWIAPDSPSYTATFRNLSDSPHRVDLKLTTRDYYGVETTEQEASLDIPAGGESTRKFTLKLKRHGYHDVVLTQTNADKVAVERRSLAYLHPDTRERGDWEPGRGPIFGYWNSAGHGEPEPAEQMRVMAMAGAEAVNAVLFPPNPLAEELKMTSFNMTAGDHFATHTLLDYLDRPEEAEEYLLRELRKHETTKSPISRKQTVHFFAEPSLGQITCGIPPDYYGVDYELSPSEQESLDRHLKAFVMGARIVKKHWPDVRCLLPWGDPVYPVYFLRASEEVRELIGGIGVDIPAFERLAETQMHQLAIHRCYVMREEFRKAGVQDPMFIMVEGPCVSVHPSSLTLKEHADNFVRLDLLLFAHGVDQLVGGWGFECNSYYGEQHYGAAGLFDRLPLNTPRPAYSALAAMSRHVNRKNLDKWLPTGSLSTYALQFKHYRTGELTHVFWTIRGKRPVTLTVPQDATVTLYDQMDNPTKLAVRNGKVTFTIDQSPCYIDGLKSDPTVSLGEPDHSDSMPAPAVVEARPAPETWSASTLPLRSPDSRPPVERVSEKLANLGDGSWKITAEEDLTYANNSHLMVARFPGKMSISTLDAPDAQGSRALAVRLEKQDEERLVMPFYTTLVPAQPIVIPGKPSHLGLWVHGASDWGRVVYCLRDAEGERWISVGAKNDWNCDDTYSASFFCFDGWRYVRFETPANSPYDQYRELGSTWWGHFGEGDGQINLPLSLEKIIVERRTHAMYVNDPQPARPDDVLLADLYVEYERPEDRTQEAVRLNQLRMPVPEGMPELTNPISGMAETGVAAPTVVTNITLPPQVVDGTRCHVHFEPVAGAKTYDVWVSAYPDGFAALKLGSDWTEPGQLITGLRQDTDFYVFVVHTDQEGRLSKPSAPLKIRLQDLFGMK